MNSDLGDPAPDAAGDHHAEAGTDETATAASTEDATTESGHAHDETASATADGDAAVADTAHGPVIAGTATGDSPCEIASPTPASPGQVGTGDNGGSEDDAGEHGARGMVAQTALTKDERVLLEQQMAQARTVIAQYPTVKDAMAAGYGMSTAYVPCIGAHYTNTRLVIGFDPAKPSELLYDGTGPDAKIVGLSYLTYNRGGAPEGFAGANDHWHQHNANGGLCFNAGGTVIGGEEMTRGAVHAAGRDEARADRHLDGARVGRARLRVQLGRVRRRVPRARRQGRRDRLGLKSPRTRYVGRSAQFRGDQSAVRRRRLSQSSRTSSASCIQVPGALDVRRAARVVNSPGSRSGMVDPLPQHDLAPARARRARPGTRRAMSATTARSAARGSVRSACAAASRYVVELRLVRPRAVFHEQRGLVFASVDRNASRGRRRCSR